MEEPLAIRTTKSYINDDTINRMILYPEYYHEIIIDNVINLERIWMRIEKENNLYVIVSNCEKLTEIESGYDEIFGTVDDSKTVESYFYIGENVNNLESIIMNYFGTVIIKDQIFDNLKHLRINTVKNLICDVKIFPALNELIIEIFSFPHLMFDSIFFPELKEIRFYNISVSYLMFGLEKFPKLKKIIFYNVNASHIILDSNINIEDVQITKCKIDTLEIIGGGKISSFDFIDNDIGIIIADKPTRYEYMFLENKDNYNKVIPYIPISIPIVVYEESNSNSNSGSDSNDYSLDISFNLDNIYDYRYKEFIKNNESEIKLTDYYYKWTYYYDSDEISLDEIKFNIPPRKKSARK